MSQLPRNYDLAISLLRALQALAERQDDPDGFKKWFLGLRAQHQRKPSLLDRFDEVGLPPLTSWSGGIGPFQIGIKLSS